MVALAGALKVVVIVLNAVCIGFSSGNVSVSVELVQSTNCLAKKYETVEGHTACLQPADTIMEKGVSEEEKELIVNLHNQYRSQEPAADMQRMVWDDELAAIAEKWADNCEYKHDAGSKRAIPGRFSVGQNLALGYNSWENVIFGWYDEVKLFTYNGTNNDFPQVGHYTQLTWSNTSKIGCAYTRCSNLKKNFFNGKFWACNYGPAGNSRNWNTPYKLMTSEKGELCPNNWNEELQLCDCGGKTCENGGELDLNTCECKCSQPHHTPDTCSLNCTAAVDARYCGRFFPPSYCAIYSNVPTECPHMCGVCPYGGIDYVEENTTPTTATTITTTRRTTTRGRTTTRARTTTERPSTTTTATTTTTYKPTDSTTKRDGDSIDVPKEIIDALNMFETKNYTSSGDSISKHDMKLFYSAVAIMNRLLGKWYVNTN